MGRLQGIELLCLVVADAWDDISSLTITKSCNKVLHSSHLSKSEVELSCDSAAGSSESTYEIDSCSTLLQQLDNNLTDEEITEWISADGEDPGHRVFSDEDIIREVTQTTTQMEEALQEDIPVITHGKAAEMLDECLRWYEQQDKNKQALSPSFNNKSTFDLMYSHHQSMYDQVFFIFMPVFAYQNILHI